MQRVWGGVGGSRHTCSIHCWRNIRRVQVVCPPLLPHLLLFFFQQLQVALLQQALPELGIAAAVFTPGCGVITQVQLSTLQIIMYIFFFTCRKSCTNFESDPHAMHQLWTIDAGKGCRIAGKTYQHVSLNRALHCVNPAWKLVYLCMDVWMFLRQDVMVNMTCI